MQSPVNSGLGRFVPDTAIAWHTLEIKQTLAQHSSDRNASLTNQLVAERLQQYGSNELQDSGSCRNITILLAQFKNILLVMLRLVVVPVILNLLASRFIKDAITILAIELHRTENHNFSFLEGRQYSIESEDSLSNTLTDCGYALQDSVDALFPYQTEATRVLSPVELSTLMFVWLELKKSFIKCCFTP